MPDQLVDRTRQVRDSVVPWEGYQQTGLITLPHLELIQKYDKKDDHDKAQLLKTEGKQYAALFLKLAESLTATDTTQYVLTLIQDMLDLNDKNKEYFIECGVDTPGHPVAPFLTLIKSDDAYIAYKALSVLTVLARAKTIEPDVAERVMEWLTQQVSVQGNQYMESVILSLMGFLRVEPYRIAFYQKKVGIKGLVTVLGRKPNYQMQYEVAFAFWLLTFTKTIARAIQPEFKIIQPLVKLLQAETPKKIVRVVVATLRNLLKHDGPSNANTEAMVLCKTHKLLQDQTTRSFDDSDLNDDIAYISERLETALEDMTTYTLYAAELMSGTLEWGPTHTSAAFWSENGSKLNNNNYEHVRALVKLIESSQDATTLAIAAHDLGEYVRVCPRGKNVVDQLDGKKSLMNLLKSSDERVQQEALLAAQKLMLNNWKGLQTAA